LTGKSPEQGILSRRGADARADDTNTLPREVDGDLSGSFGYRVRGPSVPLFFSQARVAASCLAASEVRDLVHITRQTAGCPRAIRDESA
jgi:hypothetical protein